MVFDVRPKYEIALSMGNSLLSGFSNIWTWGVNSSWLGSAQSRTRKIYVAARKTFFPNGETPLGFPISLNHFQLPSVISDFLLYPHDERFVDGEISLVEPKFANARDPILLGALTPRRDGARNELENEFDMQIKVYNSEWVSFPLGKFPHLLDLVIHFSLIHIVKEQGL